MNRGFKKGDTVVCTESGVIGKAIQFYFPTACAEQTMVITRDGRKYHAPTSWWKKVDLSEFPVGKENGWRD